ncbi:MAG: MotA/TolQ/ExbB proton channel family protein [Vampirovibrionales bacterium]|nr:MotA/TolQ/ExbB proton channel family protein [Vampirovibrionales bacterium]
MDKATVIGLILGCLTLGGALLLGHAPLQALIQPEALLMVFGGTATAVLVSFSTRTLGAAWTGFCHSLREDAFGAEDYLDYLTEISRFVRQEGTLALEPMLAQVEIPFIRQGLQLMVDGQPEAFIRNSLMTEIDITYRDDLDKSRVFEAAGGFAPTMGIVGAVIGLMSVVGSFQSPGQLGEGVAGAFSATLYGVALANLFLLPVAGKLRQRARDQWFRKTLMLEGMMSICCGDHPMMTEEKLRFFAGAKPAERFPERLEDATPDFIFDDLAHTTSR